MSKDKEKLVIGLVGEKGSGKETFTKTLHQLLPQKTIVRLRFSDILAETLKIWDLPIERANLQKIAQIMEKGFGSGTVANATKNRVLSVDADVVILDGVRWIPDVKLVRSFPNNVLVYVTADIKIRYERLKDRKEKSDEANLSWAIFKKQEHALNEIYIPKIGKNADFKIVNDKGLEEYKEQIGEFMRRFIKV